MLEVDTRVEHRHRDPFAIDIGMTLPEGSQLDVCGNVVERGGLEQGIELEQLDLAGTLPEVAQLIWSRSEPQGGRRHERVWL